MVDVLQNMTKNNDILTTNILKEHCHLLTTCLNLKEFNFKKDSTALNYY